MVWSCRHCMAYRVSKIRKGDVLKLKPKQLRALATDGYCVSDSFNESKSPDDKCWNWVDFEKPLDLRTHRARDIWAVFANSEAYPEITNLSPYAVKKRSKESFVITETISGELVVS